MRIRTGRWIFFAYGLIAFCTPARSQSPAMPPWLESYPGATPSVHTSGSMVESTYTTQAPPEEVIAHYRKMFTAAGLRFQPNPDGVGTSIRGDAQECDLLILIRARVNGTYVDASCSAKSPPSGSSSASVQVITGGTSNTRPRPAPARAVPATSPPPASAAEMMEAHQRKVTELGIHPVYHDAPAPPLAWPPWFTHVNGSAIRTERGLDQSKKSYLEGRYITNIAMTEIYHFYQNLLNSHEYRVHSSRLSTGQTIDGKIIQNALGSVEGSNYPDGAPGPYTVIRVTFSRDVVNGPITVRLRFTAYEFVAPKPRN